MDVSRKCPFWGIFGRFWRFWTLFGRVLVNPLPGPAPGRGREFFVLAPSAALGARLVKARISGFRPVRRCSGQALRRNDGLAHRNDFSPSGGGVCFPWHFVALCCILVGGHRLPNPPTGRGREFPVGISSVVFGLLLVGFGVAGCFRGLPGRAFRLCPVPSRGTLSIRRWVWPTTAATTPQGSSHPSSRGTGRLLPRHPIGARSPVVQGPIRLCQPGSPKGEGPTPVGGGSCRSGVVRPRIG